MKSAIDIGGRAAVPIRLIPFLMRWEHLAPVELAQILAGDDRCLTSYFLDDGDVCALHWKDWRNTHLPALEAAVRGAIAPFEEAEAHARQYCYSYDVSPDWDVAEAQVRLVALKALPAAVFVWRDELEGCIAANFAGAEAPPANVRVSAHEEAIVMDGFRVEAAPTGQETSPDGGDANHERRTHPIDELATPTELIEAFGNFTGMDSTWFNNLSDSPALKAARLHKGDGGRASREPLFDPFAVMQWLISEKRKKGRKISQETAWRRLHACFPKAYMRHHIADPNSD